MYYSSRYMYDDVTDDSHSARRLTNLSIIEFLLQVSDLLALLVTLTFSVLQLQTTAYITVEDLFYTHRTPGKETIIICTCVCVLVPMLCETLLSYRMSGFHQLSLQAFFLFLCYQQLILQFTDFS